jgi:hypothetical protein
VLFPHIRTRECIVGYSDFKPYLLAFTRILQP